MPEARISSTVAWTARASEVNGPEGYSPTRTWNSVDWAACERNVRRLRQRIFKASREGDLKRVRNLQKLMLRSFANTLVGVRRVTETNAGRKTAGIDGRVALTSPGKTELVHWMHQNPNPSKARPVKRVYIAMSDGRRRPLGIPVITDRVRQAQAVNALEPEREARFEQKSYGFRPGRGGHDAIESIFNTACGKNTKRLWVLDADLEAAFDRISHDHLLALRRLQAVRNRPGVRSEAVRALHRGEGDLRAAVKMRAVALEQRVGHPDVPVDLERLPGA